MTDTLIAYVDGFNLYHGLHERWGRRYLWLDLVALVESLRPKQRLSKIKYYTAGVLDDPAAQARQDNYLNALVASGGRALEIVHGRYQRKTISCRRCGASWTTYEEKETDVNIAVAIVTDAATRVASTSLVISADSDLAPAVRTAMTLNPQMFITAAFPPRRTSSELRRLMPASFVIGPGRIKAAQLPDVVVDQATRRSYCRPRNGRRAVGSRGSSRRPRRPWSVGGSARGQMSGSRARNFEGRRAPRWAPPRRLGLALRPAECAL